VELAGLEVGILAAEVEKLAVYAGGTKRIERGDVAKMVGAGRVETIWKALDAATTGQAGEALVLLDNLLAAGEIPTPMLAAMSASLLKVHHAGRLRAARLNLDEACRIAGIPPFALEKTRKQHAHLGPQRVDRLPATLLRTDLDIKGGTTLDPRVVLELLFVALSRPRTD
jgi:DNA polymerase III subunit delta